MHMGRPPKPLEERRRNKMFRLRPETIASIEQRAAQEGCRQVDVVERAIALYIETDPK